MIYLYPKISDNLVRLILQDRCWIVHIWSNLNFLHNSLWIAFPTQSCPVLYSFWANLQYLLIMWLIIWSLSSHNLHLLFCCVISILLWHSCSLWCYFVLLWEEIQFLSKSFLFLAMFKSSRVSFRLFAAWNIHTVVCFCFVLFFSCLFSSYCCSVVCVVSSRCN